MSVNLNSETESSEPSQTDTIDVIDRTAVIENVINQIIVGYCKPRPDAWEFMWSVMLDTSVMSLGAKVKLVKAISHEMNFKFDEKHLHQIVELRNAFAHHSSNAHPLMRRGKTPQENSTNFQLWVLKSSGKIDRKNRNEAFKEFNSAYRKTRDSLVELRDLVQTNFEKLAD